MSCDYILKYNLITNYLNFYLYKLMMKRFGLLNEFLNFRRSNQLNFLNKFNFYTRLSKKFNTANPGVKNLELIKILRAETSKYILIIFRQSS